MHRSGPSLGRVYSTYKQAGIHPSSPLIQYEGNWSHFGGKDGQSLPPICQQENCSATLHFTGANILAVDSQCFQLGRPGSTPHPCTNVTQNDPDPPENGTLSGQGEVNTTTPQSQRLHSIPIPVGPKVALIHFNLTSTDNSNDLRIPASEPAFAYDPPGAWSPNTTDAAGSDQGNGHQTNQSNVRVVFAFAGTRVALYGTIGFQGCNYTAQLDSGPVQIFAEQPFRLPTKNSLPDQIMFYANGLPAGNHTVTLTSQATPPQVFTVNYGIVDGEPSLPTNGTIPSSSVPSPVTTVIVTNTPLSGTTNDSGHGRLSKAQFTAIMVSVAFLITLLLAALAYIFYSRRTKKRNFPSEFVDVFPPTPPEPPHVAVEPTAELHKPRENIQTRFIEADWTSSFYSQSSVTLDDGYQARKDKMHSAYSHPNSLGVRDRRHSFDQDTEEGSTGYAMRL
ncbi:hypothetical protein C8R47DRAFT_1122526 [Mycena vitilis]|nr:hypothetical protein C8R47DRAFT_1122526 [Mycena vitilis]